MERVWMELKRRKKLFFLPLLCFYLTNVRRNMSINMYITCLMKKLSIGKLYVLEVLYISCLRKVLKSSLKQQMSSYRVRENYQEKKIGKELILKRQSIWLKCFMRETKINTTKKAGQSRSCWQK